MLSSPVELGIAGFGLAFGDNQDVQETAPDYVPDPERVYSWGYRAFHRAPDDVSATDMGAAAARQALGRLDLEAADASLIALALSEVPEYPHWDSCSAIARKLGVRKVQTLLLTEGCSSGSTGLAVIAGTLAQQPEIDTVLFMAVNRVSEFHRNRMSVNNAVHSDGAVAAVLRRGHPALRWLGTDQFTIPDLGDWFRTRYGGATAPVPPAGWSISDEPPGHEQVQAHFSKDPGQLREFGQQAIDWTIAVISGACARTGLTRDDIDHLIYLNDPDGITDIAKVLGLPLERTNLAIAAAHGHMGAADQLVALAEQVEDGTIKSGDVVALAGISIGMRWFATVLRA